MYESDYGFCIQVASKRILGEIPEQPSFELPQDEWMIQHRLRNLALNVAPREDIDLPGAGSTSYHADLRDLYDALMELRRTGYHVPQFALDNIKEEWCEDERERLSASGVEEAG